MRRAALPASVMLCLALSWCYWMRPDAGAAITLFPVWGWLLPAAGFLALGCERGRRRRALAVAGMWLVFFFAFADEPVALMRGPAAPPPPSGRPGTLRVVSLNCAVGTEACLREVEPFRPDVVLLQESPGRTAVAQAATRLWGKHGAAVWGANTSILARGSLEEAVPPRHARFTQARVRLASGETLVLFSAHLLAPVVRFDLWSPSCWRDQTESRRARRPEMEQLVRAITAVPADMPVLLGGDFNAPAGDAVFFLLRPRLRETFAAAGRGWGNTVLNDFPVLRIDQVWASAQLRPAGTWAVRTQHSDHRMVVCDLVMP